MKWVVLIFFLPLWVFAQEEGYGVIHALSGSPVSSKNSSLLTTPFPELAKLTTRLAHKQDRFKSDKDFLSYLFTQTHQRLLKNYSDNSSYEELITKGDYNCLTGTTAYALLLEHFGFTYSIIETNYHIFLMVSTESGSVLLETTDPLHGFTDRDEDIQKRIAAYKENKLVTSRQDQYYFSFSLYREVTLRELEGLLYYNASVRAFNANKFDEAITALSKTYSKYYSARVDEFSKVLLLSVANNEKLELSKKASYVKQLQAIRKSRLDATASK